MPTSLTVVSVFNLALDLIGEFPVSTRADDNVYARWLNRNYAHYVETALRQQPWNFACEYHVLLPSATKPAFRWDSAYDLPPGWLRVLPPTTQGSRRGRPMPYEVKSNMLLMNGIGERPIEVVMNRQEPGEWDSLFATMIAARLANGLAHRFTGKNSYVEMTKIAAAEALDTAAEINAFEGSIPEPDEYDIIRARHGGNLETWR